MIMLHINIIMLLIDTNISHVNIIILHVDIIYLACRGQKYATMDFYIYISGRQYVMFRYL